MNAGHAADLAATETHDLRRRVLRVGTPSSSVEWDGDDEVDTWHLGVMIIGRDQPIAISTWLDRCSPDLLASSPGRQLRGMATDPDSRYRGHGHGLLLLHTGVERALRTGATHVWANARSDVLGFYTAHGFEVVSDEFESVDTAIAHRRILLHLQSGQSTPAPAH